MPTSWLMAATPTPDEVTTPTPSDATTDPTDTTTESPDILATLTVSTYSTNGSSLFDTNIRVSNQNQTTLLSTGPDSNMVQFNQTIPQDGRLGVIATKQGYAANGFLWQSGDESSK